MRARTVNFEKTGDPMKTMKIGSHRELKGQQLIDHVFDIVWDELKDDPKFAKEDRFIFKDNVYNWVVDQIENPEDWGDIDPNDITADHYKLFIDEITDPEEEEIDWDQEWEEHWEEEHN